MGQFFDSIPESMIPWILKQKMFWVATAPLQEDGHVNVSPKGLDGTFHLVDRNKVWYEDLTGSGNETISHLRQNGRITVMLSAFEGPPRIMRLFGKGTVHEFGTPEYKNYIPPEKRLVGSRSVIVVDIHKVGSSCGFSVPFYTFKAHRNQLLSYWNEKEANDRSAQEDGIDRAENGVKAYWAKKNAESIDGLPGVQGCFAEGEKIVTKWMNYPKDDLRVSAESSPTKAGSSANAFDMKILSAFLCGVILTMLLQSLDSKYWLPWIQASFSSFVLVVRSEYSSAFTLE